MKGLQEVIVLFLQLSVGFEFFLILKKFKIQGERVKRKRGDT